MIGSFRDPDGRLLAVDGRIIRIIKKSAASDLQSFLTSKTIIGFLKAGKLVSTQFLERAAIDSLAANETVQHALEDFDGGVVVEHERIPFASFPYEWPPEMLYAAAELTLDMAERMLPESIGLKDATPFNVLYRGTTPVFIDLLSFERRDPGDQTWLPLAQFTRTFLIPLLVNKYFGIRLDQIFLSNRDGLEAQDVIGMCGPLQKLRPPFLTFITLPARLSSRPLAQNPSIYEKHITGNPEKANFILTRVFKGLRRKLKSVRPVSTQSSPWVNYMEQNDYTENYFPLKEQFVKSALEETNPRRVLDLGCNTGYFSFMVARTGASVVSIDSDPVVVGKVWSQASAENLDILPLVVNLARPTPSLGWLNMENPSFLDRARSTFDGLLMLAVLHHLLVTERIPLPEIMRLAAQLTKDLLVIEYVGTQDPMFRCIARGRDHLHESLTVDYFENVSKRFFSITRAERLGETHRRIYMMRRKPGA
jgi:SAM-dependent methyltransferase